MSGNGVGETVRTWWLMSLRPEHHPKIGEDTSAARALRARLRRPSAPTEVLAERAVHDLVRRVPALRKQPGDLIQLVCTLAEVKRERLEPNAPRKRLAVRLGEAEEGGETKEKKEKHHKKDKKEKHHKKDKASTD